MICYVTAYYDIGRESWPYFSRTFDDYLAHFKPYIKLFDKSISDNDEMFVFIDERYYNTLQTLINESSETHTNITLISLTKELLNELPIWKTLSKEQEILNDKSFKILLGDRANYNYPETLYAEYTLINHCKIDFVSRVIDKKLSKADFYCWTDFGFFANPANIPDKLLDIEKFNVNTINYTLINNIMNIDADFRYVLRYAPETIGGFFFLGHKDKIKDYQSLYHFILKECQEVLRIADDDQHLALRCYFACPDIFSFGEVMGWHKVYIKNQKE